MSFDQVPIEEVISFWDRRPCNIHHSPKPIGTREYFDEVEKRKYFVEPHIPRFAQFERWKGKKVLEIGCGIGTDTINFARHGAHVTAIDISPKSVNLVAIRAKVYGLEDKIKLYVGNAEKLSEIIPPEPYDLVYSFGVIHHTPHPERVIAQVRLHYCHTDTVFKLMVYHRYSWKVLWILFKYGKGRFWDLKRLIAQYSEAQTGCPVTYTFSKREITKLLERNAFRVQRIWIDHIFPYKISSYKQYQYEKVWYFRHLPSSLFRFLETHFGWHMCIDAILA